MKNLSIVLADDHPMFRKGLASFLKRNPAFEAIHEAGNGLEVLTIVEKEKIDLVLLDIRMPKMDGIQTLRELKKKYPLLKVIMISMYDDAHYIDHAMENKANAFLLKNADPAELLRCIELVLEGHIYYAPPLAAQIVRGLKVGANVPDLSSTPLTEREIQILKYMCEQHNNAEIGELMNISESTVKTFKKALIRKTKSKNSVGLVLFAVKNNLYEFKLGGEVEH